MIEFSHFGQPNNIITSNNVQLKQFDIILSSIISLNCNHGGLAQIPTTISLASTNTWYMPLTPFETLFIFIALLQVVILRILEILPVNMNNLFTGDPTGRRKRAVPDNTEFQNANKQIAHDEVIIMLLEIVDKVIPGENCDLKLICQISSIVAEFKNEYDDLQFVNVLRNLSKNTIPLLEEKEQQLRWIAVIDAFSPIENKNATCNSKYKSCGNIIDNNSLGEYFKQITTLGL